jgi:hypothetical protein
VKEMNKKRLMAPIIFLLLIITVGLAGCTTPVVETEKYVTVSDNTVRLYGIAYPVIGYTHNPSSSGDVKFKFSTSEAGCNCNGYNPSTDIYVDSDNFRMTDEGVVYFNAIKSELTDGETYYFRACVQYYPKEPDRPVFIGGEMLSFIAGQGNGQIVNDVEHPSIVRSIDIIK